MSDSNILPRRISVGRGHGKLLLFGEHCAVYGYPACGLTLDMVMQVSLVRSGDPSRSGNSWILPPLPPEISAQIDAFLAGSRRLFPDETEWGGAIQVESDIPVGLGFGSSAAWCAAFVSAMSEGKSDLVARWKLAHEAEAFFHGTPSGIDTGLALLDGLYAFTPSPPELPEAERLRGGPLYLVAGAVPRRSSTRELVGGLKARLDREERGVRDTISKLGELSRDATALLRSRPTPHDVLGELARDAHALLSRLGLSTPLLDELIKTGIDLGATGGKLSGAGGGGAFYLVYGDHSSAEAGARALRARAAELRIEVPIFAVSRPEDPAPRIER